MAEEADEILIDGILDSLEVLGCSGELVELEGANLQSAVKDGVSSAVYTGLIHSLCSELKSSNNLQESVSLPQGQEDAEAFQLELRSLLSELHCPHTLLTLDVTVLKDYHQRVLVLDYLVSEVMATRCVVQRERREERMEVEEEEEEEEVQGIRGNLAAILKCYGFDSPPPHVTIKQIYEKIIGKTREVLKTSPSDCLGSSLLKEPLSEEQWATIRTINDSLTAEYGVRRRMLLTRCDVTIQSFGWSDKAKEDKVSKVFQERRDGLTAVSPVSLARLLAAKDNLLSVTKTNDISVRGGTQCAINRVLIGKVPDRGGRPRETRPSAEMPTFRKRTEMPQEQRQGGGRGRGKGGWSGGGEKSKKGKWGHQGSRDGYHGYQGGGKQQQYYS